MWAVNNRDQNVLPHCFWFSSFIPLWAASSLLSFSLSSLGLRYSDISCSYMEQHSKWERGPWERDSFTTLDLWSGTLFLSLSGSRLHSLLLSKNWKLTSSLLHTDQSFSFFSICQCTTSNACMCSVRVVKWAYHYVFVRSQGSCEMGHHK